MELFRIAAPLFAEFGYRGATIRRLADACHLSPAGLYHHFGSKLELALFPVLGREASLQRCREMLRSSSPDAVVRLRILIDSGLEDLPDFLLALRLAEESGYKPRAEGALRAIFRDGVATFATVAREAAPRISSARAMEFAQAAIAIFLSSAVPGFERNPAALRAQLLGLAQTYLVPLGLEHLRLERLLGAGVTGAPPRSVTERNALLVRSAPL